MMWLSMIAAALVIAWLASSAVRKQKLEDRMKHPELRGKDPSQKNEVGQV